jgi:hypothetical protein
MASNELSKRTNWQTISGAKALETEKKFIKVLQLALDSVYPKQFNVEQHPTDFNNIYSSYILPNEILEQIYNVDVATITPEGKRKYSWGIRMDFAIRNLKSGKVLFGEIKRQNGWVETTSMAAGRGNAHERSCKYFTPGLLKALREASGISEEILPFWVVLVGDITRDPRRNRELAFWYQGYEMNYYMWRDTENITNMLDFFENNLLPYLL